MVAHFDNPTTGTPTHNHLTLIDLIHGNSQQTYTLPDPVLAVSFGVDNQAFVVTAKQFLLYNPVFQYGEPVLDTVADIEAKSTPATDAAFPLDVTTTTISRSSDGTSILGVGGSTSTITFRYDVASQTVTPGEITLSTGNLGPRVVSLNHDGSLAMVGWIEIAQGKGITNLIPQSSNQLSVGTSLFDDSRGLIYAQIPPSANAPPILQILAQDNLTVIQQLRLPENTTGKSALSSDSGVMYSISASGVLVLPVGFLTSLPAPNYFGAQRAAPRQFLQQRRQFANPDSYDPWWHRHCL